jgi:hypothetical protein
LCAYMSRSQCEMVSFSFSFSFFNEAIEDDLLLVVGPSNHVMNHGERNHHLRVNMNRHVKE